MRKSEAIEIVRAVNEERARHLPQHPTPDRRTIEEQLEEKSFARFTERLAEAALDREQATGSWPPEDWFNRHRRNFQQLRLRASEGSGPPCKRWAEGQEENPFKRELTGIWRANLRKWALKYPYLASPTARCECRRCSPEAHNDPYGFTGALTFPSDR